MIVFGGLALLYADVSPLIGLTAALAALAAVLCFGGTSYRRFVRQCRETEAAAQGAAGSEAG